MSGVSQGQLERILALSEALAGEPFGERGLTLAQIAAERAMAFCCREDVPPEMEQAVASLLCAVHSRESGVKSVTRGDTAVAFETAQNAEFALLRPWCKLGVLKKG